MAALLSSPSFFSLHASPSRFISPRRLPFLRMHASSISELNISFAPTQKTLTLVPDPSPQNYNPSPSQPLPLVIPWIVRDGNVGFKMESTAPARFLHAMAEAKEATLKKEKKKKTTKKKELKPAAAASSSPPPYSKAARRFYNQKIWEPQRLSKVLAAAGVASKWGSEELIFGGKVTVNGSVCTAPQPILRRVSHILPLNYRRSI